MLLPPARWHSSRGALMRETRCFSRQWRSFCDAVVKPTEQAASSTAPGGPPPRGLLVRCMAPTDLRREPREAAETLYELPCGELMETFADFTDVPPEWVLVRRPLENDIEVMSDKPLLYEAGWLQNAQIERAEYQLGEKVCVKVEARSHILLDMARKMPIWKTALPGWLTESLAEVYSGKVAGVVQQGRFMIQRPSGAIPERFALEDNFIMRRRQVAKRTLAGVAMGAVVATALGFLGHSLAWCGGAPLDSGLKGWPRLVGWLTIGTVFITPGSYLACYIFTTSQMAAAALVVWLDMLMYKDLFGE